MRCSNCGNEIEEGKKFCTKCGRKAKNEIEEGKNTINNKETITIKFNHLVIGIIVTIIVLACIIGASIYINFNDTNNDTSNIIENNNNANTENITKEWYNTVSAQDTISENTEENILEEIYAKYPDLRNTEGIICTDGTDYWLLDESGNKVYFTDLDSFENALKQINLNIENITNSSNSTSNDSPQQNKEYVEIPKLTGLTEQEAINTIKKLNVPYEISYKEDLNKEEGIVIGQSYHDVFITNNRGEIVAASSTSRLYPGETLYIFVNKINERTMILNLHRTCLIKEYISNKKGINTGLVNSIDESLKLVVKANDSIIFTDQLTNADLDVELYNCTTSEVKYTGKTSPKIDIIINGEIFRTFSSEEMSNRFYDDTANENGQKWYIGFTEHGAS